MKLFATLPSLKNLKAVSEVLGCPDFSDVRLNTGVYSPYSPRESLQEVQRIEDDGKIIWVDLDGRQLRVKNWSYPSHGGKVCLNRSVNFSYPARINFRNDGWYDLEGSRGRSVFFGPMPRHALGNGQTVNISALDLEIKGPYLTGLDKQYIIESLRLGINHFMLSFFEGQGDIDEVMKVVGNKEVFLCLKIENDKGFLAAQSLVKQKNITLMAARDDWYLNSGNKASFLKDVRALIDIDPEAIVASRIFSGLEKSGEVSLGDWEDLALMERFGYKNFMFSDGLCEYRFKEAMSAWREYMYSREEL